MKKYNFFTSNVDPKTFTLADLESAMESMRNQQPQPQYTLIPDYAVDDYLKQGIIPQFVIVSSKSHKKIEQYIKDSAPSPQLEIEP